jgi:hypothetical protein
MPGKANYWPNWLVYGLTSPDVWNCFKLLLSISQCACCQADLDDLWSRVWLKQCKLEP